MIDPRERWYTLPKGSDVHQAVFHYVRRIEDQQGDVYDRLAMLESLYDQYSPTGDDTTDPAAKLANVSENIAASNVDTVYASIANADIRPRFLTDNADWSVQRRAKKLEFYAEGLGKLLGVPQKLKLSYKESPKKGMALVKVYADAWDRPAVEIVPLEDIVVPDADARIGAPPLQLHHVQRNYDRDRLKAEYPDRAEEIDASYGMRSSSMMESASSSRSHWTVDNNKIVVIESIRLPIGERQPGGKEGKAKAKYIPGRRVIVTENLTLLDEAYHEPYHPFAMASWSERLGSFYPISGIERIVGIQRALNKRNWQIERVLDQNALLTTYVRPADGNLRVQTTKAGNICVIKSDYPQTPNPPLVAAETYQSRRDLKESAPEQMGVSRFASQSAIPAGLETGAAVREYSAQATVRFSPQEAAYEQFVLDTYWLLVAVCKRLGDKAPAVLPSRWHKSLSWADVDLDQAKIQISAASTLPRTAAGREQTVLEWAQAGVISTDSAKRLIGHPDLERELSMYTSALEVIEMEIEMMLEGEISTPEPFDNLSMAVWRVRAAYNNARMAKAPEAVLESLRDYISQAAYILDQQNSANPNGVPPGQQALPLPPGSPGGSQPGAAFSPQAMQLVAGA